MSPTSTARNRSTLRKVTLCAAAIVVTLLPTACGSAYAASHVGHTSQVVEVGGADAAEPAAAEPAAADQNADEPAAADENADGEDGEQNAGKQNAGDEEKPADEKPVDDDKAEDAAAKDAAAKDKAQNGQDKAEEKGKGEDNNGLDVLGRDCSKSKLEPHNGFQEAPRCVSTEFGEVASEDKSPSLLITESPQTVKAGEDFTISVSTRNLVRDRFLGAAAGGYYLESSFLDGDGIQRGHFHTACRMLESTSEAPDAAPDPEFFVATQDNGGGEAPDTVKIDVTGMPNAGTAQCAVWAGDGSHRVPMMQRANQTPAFDVVRITVE
jgi:hypothetical protein